MEGGENGNNKNSVKKRLNVELPEISKISYHMAKSEELAGCT